MIILKILGVILLSLAAGTGYRMGGSGNWPRWTREVIVGLAIVLEMMMWFGFHWSLIFCFGATWIETTYFKKGPDAKWYNWLLVGLSFSIVLLPWCIFNQHWIGFLARTFTVTLFTTLWRTFVGKDVVQEFGAGAIQTLTLPLLLIP